jgi:O-antigen/teichoic acid export membrane protein
MTGGQIAALIVAILLLLPGGCFVILGFGMMSESADFGTMLLVVGIVILAVMGLFFWVAFRKRPPSPGSNTSGP